MANLGTLRALWQEKTDTAELACKQLRTLFSNMDSELGARCRQESLTYSFYYDLSSKFEEPFTMSFADETKAKPPQITFSGTLTWLGRESFRIAVDDRVGEVASYEKAVDFLIETAVERVKAEPQV